MTLRVLRCQLKSARRDVGSVGVGGRHGVEHADGDTPGARPHVGEARRVVVVEQGDREVDEQLGLGTRNEDAVIDGEVERVKGVLAREVRHGHGRRPAG